jgi:hypothetical protein
MAGSGGCELRVSHPDEASGKSLCYGGLGGNPREIPSSECANLVVWSESVAQLVEHRPFKALVLGSSPSALTIIFNNLQPELVAASLKGRT